MRQQCNIIFSILNVCLLILIVGCADQSTQQTVSNKIEETLTPVTESQDTMTPPVLDTTSMPVEEEPAVVSSPAPAPVVHAKAAKRPIQKSQDMPRGSRPDMSSKGSTSVNEGRKPASIEPVSEAEEDTIIANASENTPPIPEPKVTNEYNSDTVHAQLAYKYPNSIRQNELKDVWVYVKPHVTPYAVVTTLKKRIENYETELEEDDTINIFTQQIPLYNNLTITLDDDAKNFTITRKHVSDRQVIDTANGNQWHWTIITNTTKEKADLIINTLTDDGDGNTAKSVITKKIPIRIYLEGGWFRRWYTWLLLNPEYVIGTLLVPLIVFFGKRFFDKKKAEKES